MEEMRKACHILVGKAEGTTSLWRPRHWWEDSIRMDLREWDGKVWTGFIWLRIRTSGGLLWTRSWTFGYRKRREISWRAEWLLACQGWLCSMELVSSEHINRQSINSGAETDQGNKEWRFLMKLCLQKTAESIGLMIQSLR
jgi:hypothetical protein